MSVAQLCPDDLLVAARRGALGAQDEARLTLHLQRCERCRAALDVGRAFDLALGAHVGDDAIASRLAARVTRRPARRWLGYALGGGLLLVGSAAVAAVGTRVWQRVFAHQQVEAPVSPNPAVTAHVPARVVVPELKPALAPPAASSESAAGTATEARAPAPIVDPARGVEAATPASLFARANELRGQGDVRGARQVYLELQARFPGSVESSVSLVSLGRIELGAEPARALGRFDSYLAQSWHTTLKEEALFGRASALSRLGREVEERATWQQLLNRFPSSIYAERARARLTQGAAADTTVQSKPESAAPSSAAPPAASSTARPGARRQ